HNSSQSATRTTPPAPHPLASFQTELGAMGYRFQFITLAGFHALNASMFELARGYAESGMTAYVELQNREFEMEAEGYTATRHQREVGAGYFDLISQTLANGQSSTLALDRKSTRLNSSHVKISYAVFCLKKK